MMINFQQLVFYTFAALLVGSAIMVVASRYPVRAVLFLVLCFFASAVIWMLLQAEFLALTLIFVYVGAVMTLFLFVVMMLNLGVAPRYQRWVRYLPLGIIFMVLFMVVLLQAINVHSFPAGVYHAIDYPANYSNTKQLGALLYTHYVYVFELAAVLLLVAIVAAISLAFRGSLRGTKTQRRDHQVATQPQQRVRLISMPAERS